MLFQKSDPGQQIARKLETETNKRESLSNRLTDAETNVASAAAVAVKLAADGATDDELDAAEAKQRAAAHRVGTVKAALVDADAAVTALANDLAAHLDRKQRAETAIQIEAMAHDLESLEQIPPDTGQRV